MIRLVHVTDLVVTVAPAIEIGKTHAGIRRVDSDHGRQSRKVRDSADVSFRPGR